MSEWLDRIRAQKDARSGGGVQVLVPAPPLRAPPPPPPPVVEMRAPEEWLQRVRLAASERMEAGGAEGRVMAGVRRPCPSCAQKSRWSVAGTTVWS